jgi:predicted HNH restriction endonuclease
MVKLVTAETAVGSRPLYFPFELGNRDVRPMQGYAFKLPASFLALFPELAGAKVAAPDAQGAAQRNPPWSRDELILALDLYMTNPASPPSQGSAEVTELGAALSRMARLLGVSTAGTFRNANSVYMKMMNFRRLDPAFTGTGLTRGNKDEAVIWEEFSGDRRHLAAVAAAIRAAVASEEAPDLQIADDDGIEEAAEGRILTRLHHSRSGTASS